MHACLYLSLCAAAVRAVCVAMRVLCWQIVFGSPLWVGKPEENPEEKALPLPAELEGVVLHEGPPDYSYGAGALCCAVLCCLRAGVKTQTCTGVCS
jgi:hypothetical protein